MRRIVIVCAVLAAACGGEGAPAGEAADRPAGEAPEAAAAGIDACSLLEPEDVQAVTGEPMQARLEERGRGEVESYLSICTFDPVNEESTGSVSISYRPSPEITDPADALERQIQDVRENVMPEYTLEPVDELGPGAGWDPDMSQLTVMRPGAMLLIDAPGDREAAVELARRALERIPG